MYEEEDEGRELGEGFSSRLFPIPRVSATVDLQPRQAQDLDYLFLLIAAQTRARNHILPSFLDSSRAEVYPYSSAGRPSTAKRFQESSKALSPFINSLRGYFSTGIVAETEPLLRRALTGLNAEGESQEGMRHQSHIFY